jgi:hypothetical protein
MSKSLYDEAIAEAKQLRDVAEQNAKNAIVEAVTPRIRQFIEEQLVKENSSAADDENFLSDVVSESLGLDAEEDVILDETAISSLLRLVDSTGSVMDEQSQSRDVIIDALGESFNSLTNDEKRKILEMAKNLKSRDGNSQPDVIDIDTDKIQENNQMSNETLYEIDLDELSHAFRSALKEADIAPEKDEAYMRGKEEMVDEEFTDYMMDEQDDAEDVDEVDLDDDVAALMREISLRVDIEGIPDDVDITADQIDISLMDDDLEDDEGDALAPEDDELDFGAIEIDDSDAGGEEEALDEMFEIDPGMLKREILKMRKSLSEGEAKDMASHFGGGSILKEPLEMTDADINVHSENRQLRGALRTESRKNRALSGKIAEYRGAVKSLREQLTEMNLFNAKLLYVNKLIQSHSVSPGKRRSIIESLDKAQNLREVKLLYRSLTQSLDGGGKKSLSESRRRTMGSSSRATPSASADRSAGSAGEVDRWARLAGLK